MKKAEHRRIDAFELWCWRVPWTARRSNQSILKEISPGCSLEGLMLKLKLQYLDHLMRRVDSLEKTLMLGGTRGRRMTEDEMAGWHHWLDGHGFGWTLGVGDGQGGLACCGSWGCKQSETTERLNWTYISHSWPIGGQGMGCEGNNTERKNQDDRFLPPVCQELVSWLLELNHAVSLYLGVFVK